MGHAHENKENFCCKIFHKYIVRSCVINYDVFEHFLLRVPLVVYLHLLNTKVIIGCSYGFQLSNAPFAFVIFLILCYAQHIRPY